MFSHVGEAQDADSYVLSHDGEAPRHPRTPQETPRELQDAPGDPKAPEGLPRARFETSFGMYFPMIFKTKPDAKVDDGTKSR